MSRRAIVVRGHIGWANDRAGTEFYDERGRHAPRLLAGESTSSTGQRGSLLVDQIDRELGKFGLSEGAEAVVLVKPRFARLSLRQRLAVWLLR